MWAARAITITRLAARMLCQVRFRRPIWTRSIRRWARCSGRDHERRSRPDSQTKRRDSARSYHRPLASRHLSLEFVHVEHDNSAALHLDNAAIHESAQIARNQIANRADLSADLLIRLFKRKLDAAPRAHSKAQGAIAQKASQPVTDLFQRQLLHQARQVAKARSQSADDGDGHLGIVPAQVEELALGK